MWVKTRSKGHSSLGWVYGFKLHCILSADGVLLGEFGEERRNFTPLAQIPKVMQHAVLASEDARFYEHSGVDWQAATSAAWACANC